MVNQTLTSSLGQGSDNFISFVRNCTYFIARAAVTGVVVHGVPVHVVGDVVVGLHGSGVLSRCTSSESSFWMWSDFGVRGPVMTCVGDGGSSSAEYRISTMFLPFTM